MLFINRYLNQVRESPQFPAIADALSEVSYEELFCRARRLAWMLAGESSTGMIGVVVSRSVEYIVSVLAIHLLGRTVVPLDGNYPVIRLKQMITSIDLSLCLVSHQQTIELTGMLQECTHLLHIEDTIGGATGEAEFMVAADDDTPAYVVFTSGTTGVPKPVLVPYRALSTLIDWMAKAKEPKGTTLLYAAQGFDVSFQEIYATLCYGDRLLIATDAHKKDLRALFDYLAAGKVTRLFLPTSMLIPLVKFGLQEGGTLVDLEQVIVAGEQLKVTPAVRQWFKAHPHCRLINHYGPSETHVVMIYQLEDEPGGWPDLPPIGQVTAGSDAWLFDEQLKPVARGDCGQLYISGRSLALGYFRMPEQTEEKFITHPFTQERMYNTGDMCVLNKQAQYEYKGRRDRQCKLRGYRVELKEIEAAVANSGLVDDCLVVALQTNLITSLVLYFAAHESDQDLSLSLHAHLAATLPEYMLPSFYKKIAAIPLTLNGKADTAKLPPISGLRSQLSSSYVAPRGQLQTLVCELAAECFGIDRLGVDDNFLEAGANSFTLMAFLAELRHVLGHSLRQTDLFEYPTPRLLCGIVQRSKQVPESKVPVVSVTQRKLRSAAIHSVHGKKRG
ncbi:non-ribosomal peptide synthetase [Pseudomonas sp. GNP012]|jgi:amino acid adenylation domain-containing protein